MIVHNPLKSNSFFVFFDVLNKHSKQNEELYNKHRKSFVDIITRKQAVNAHENRNHAR